MLAQTYKKLEIIVIDDGSTDNTSEIAGQYPVKLIRQQNQGVSVARNAGMAIASGEYLHFMDVDDFINLHFYERLLDAIIPDNADIALSGLIHERMPGFSTRITEKFLYINPEDKLLFSNVYCQGQSVKYLFKTSFLKEKKLTFDPQLRNAQDRVFAMQAVYFSNKVVTAPGALYYYKHRSNSLRTSSTKEKVKEREQHLKIADAFCADFARQHKIKKFITPRFVTFWYKFLGMPMFKKDVYYTGRVKWYFFGVYILQRKTSNNR
jgi:glycosyltransferase involved in cell wall biosynthesis